MIEQGIFFALGCIVTALGALMFAPIFWSRALRLTRKRLQLQIPVSMQEIYAERDAMRAEFAVERLRIEQELERVRAGKAGDMAEIGRRSMEATRLNAELAALRDELARGAGPLSATFPPVAAALTAAEGDRLIEAGTAQARLQALDDELAAAREREKSFHLQNSLKAEKGRTTDRALADRLDRLQTENATLQAALDEALRGGKRLAASDDAGLRESIHALGLAVAAMTQAAGPAPSEGMVGESMSGERDEAAALN